MVQRQRWWNGMAGMGGGRTTCFPSNQQLLFPLPSPVTCFQTRRRQAQVFLQLPEYIICMPSSYMTYIYMGRVPNVGIELLLNSCKDITWEHCKKNYDRHVDNKWGSCNRLRRKNSFFLQVVAAASSNLLWQGLGQNTAKLEIFLMKIQQEGWCLFFFAMTMISNNFVLVPDDVWQHKKTF